MKLKKCSLVLNSKLRGYKFHLKLNNFIPSPTVQLYMISQTCALYLVISQKIICIDLPDEKTSSDGSRIGLKEKKKIIVHTFLLKLCMICKGLNCYMSIQNTLQLANCTHENCNQCKRKNVMCGIVDRLCLL